MNIGCCCCSVTKPCPSLCNPMGFSKQGFPILHYLPEFAQSHVICVSDAIQPSYPLSPPFPLALNLPPPSGSFPINRLFAWGGQSNEASASASVFPVNIQDWFPLRLTGLISLLSKGLSRIFSSPAIWKHQFFSTQPSLWSSSHIHTWLLEKS